MAPIQALCLTRCQFRDSTIDTRWISQSVGLLESTKQPLITFSNDSKPFLFRYNRMVLANEPSPAKAPIHQDPM